VAQNITVSGVLSGTGELTIQGTTQPAAGNTRALILRNTANNYEGTFTVTSQQNLLNQATSGAGKTLGTSTVRLRGGTLQIRDNGTGNNGTLAYGNNIETGAPTDLLQPGISTLFVDRFSANTGNTIALGTLTMGDHTLALTGANGYRASFSGGTFNGNAVLQTNDTTVPILNGNYGGTGGFTKAGTGSLVFAGTSSYTGSTVVSAGTLTLTGSVASSSRVDVKSGAILNVAGVTSGFVVPVEQVLTGAGTVQGGVTVDGKLAPGDGIGTMGTLVFTTTVTLDGTAEFEIRKQGVVLSSDVAGVTGSLTLGGILNVTAVGDPLAFGDTFDLFDAGSFLGNFTDINLPGLPGGLAWSTDQLATEGEITVVPEPGAVGMLLGGLGVLVGVRRRHDARLARR
jgi:autotransporter-associated beta strand protein